MADKYVVYRISRTSFTGNFEINQAAGIIIKLVFAGFGEEIGYNSWFVVREAWMRA